MADPLPPDDKKRRTDRIKSYIHLVRKQFECPICIDFFEKPVVTNCQHAFCKNCIEGFIGNKRSQSCPMCKKSINLRSLSNFDALENWVAKVKNLVESLDKDLGIDNTNKATSSRYLSVLQNHANSDSANASLNTSATNQKRKRSVSNESKISKKKKSEVNLCPKKAKGKKKASNVENLNSNLENQDINKVHEWLNKNESPNPFDENVTSSKKKQFQTTTSPKDILKETTNTENNSNSDYTCEGNRTTSTNVDVDSAGADLRVHTNDHTGPKKSDKPLKFCNMDENGTSDENAPAKVAPKLFNTTSKILKNLRFNKENKTPHAKTQISAESETYSPLVNNNEVSIIFQEETIESKKSSSEQELSKSTRPRLKRINPIPLDGISFRKRRPIKFFYRGSIKDDASHSNHIVKSSEDLSKEKYPEMSIIKEDKTQQTTQIQVISCGANTMRYEYVDVSTQTEETEKYLQDYDHIESRLIDMILQEIEVLITDEFIKHTISDMTKKSRLKLHSQKHEVITETPPTIESDENLQKTIRASPEQESNINTVITDSCVIPDTVPIRFVIPDTCALPSYTKENSENKQEIVVTENPMPKLDNQSKKSNASGMNQFFDLMESTRLSAGDGRDNKKGKKFLFKRDRLPTLEFLDKSETTHIREEIKTPTTPRQNNIKNQFLHRKLLMDQNLVIVDTPQKSDECVGNFKELDKTLSKSASRVEFVDSKVLESSTSRFESFEFTDNRTHFDENSVNKSKAVENTMAYEHVDINETVFDEDENNAEDLKKADIDIDEHVEDLKVVSNAEEIKEQNEKEVHKSSRETVQISNDLDVNEKQALEFLNSSYENKENNDIEKTDTQSLPKFSMSPPKRAPIKTVLANQSNHSILMDSIDVTEQATNMLPPSTSKRDNANRIPPAAADILGVSYMGSDSVSICPTNVSEHIHDTSKMNHSLYKSNETNKTNQVLSGSVKNDDVFKVPSADIIPKKSDSMETQLLTDSELFVIDNLCKDMYSVHNQTIDASSEIPEITVKSASNIKKKSNRFEFVCSLLPRDKKELIVRFSKIIKATMSDDVTETTTHLIVESGETLLCGVTSKYLKAISRKIWIVSYQWILACVKGNQLLDPAAFEIIGDGILDVHNGPNKSRNSKSKLFASYEFLFIGKFESDPINLNDYIKLSNLNGANVVRKAKDFNDDKIRMVLFEENCKFSVKNANFMLKSAKIFSLTTAWLRDSLATYSIRDFKIYALYTDT